MSLEGVVRWAYIGGSLALLGVAAVALANGHDTGSVPQLLVFCLAPSLAGVALLAALLLDKATRLNLLLALLSSAATLYAAEIALSYYLDRSETARRAAEAAGSGWDGRTRIQVAMHLRRSGVNAYPRLSGWDLRRIQLELDGRVVQPLAPSVAGAVVVLCRETGRYLTYTADEHGFNNPAGAWKNANTVLLGDSYVHGYCVPESETMAHLLRARWPRLLNLGVAGTGPLMQLGILKEYGAARRPRRVIWVYYEGNDLSDLGAEATSTILRRYLEPGFSQRLLQDQQALDPLLANRVGEIINEIGEGARGFSGGTSIGTRLRTAATLRVLRGLVGVGARFPRSESPLGSLPAIYAEAERTVESWGGRLYLVYLPALSRYQSWLGEPVPGRHELLETAARLGVQVIDLEPAFRATGDPSKLWVPGGHLNARGYSLASERILAGSGD